MAPYEGTKHHFLLVLKQVCVNCFGEVPAPACVDLFAQIKALKERYQLSGYVVLIRAGDMEETGGSVGHFHVHVLVGSARKSPTAKRIRVKVGYYNDAPSS